MEDRGTEESFKEMLDVLFIQPEHRQPTVTYEQFLRTKEVRNIPTGLRHVPPINPLLFTFQRDIVRWALQRGRSAVWADCGLGKGLIALSWAEHVPGDVLIVAPLAVSQQFVREAQKINVSIGFAKTAEDIAQRITVTNYERLHHFEHRQWGGVVLDESAILRDYTGATRNQIIQQFLETPFKLSCSATPAPNDYMELGNQSEFLGIMSRVEMLAMFFTHDGGETSKWRLKGHAEDVFWRWLSSWAVMFSKPSDLGYLDDGFILPPLNMHNHVVKIEKPSGDYLFPTEAQTLAERISARRNSVDERVNVVADIVKRNPGKRFLCWCNLNSESDALKKAIPGSVAIVGSDSPEYKEQAILDFLDGKITVLISKPTITGYGLNLQCCADMAFVGLNDSYEQFYQALRRCWRFGQKEPVNAHIVSASTEGAVMRNIQRKETDAQRMRERMVEHMKDFIKQELHESIKREEADYVRVTSSGHNWTLHLGDCVDIMREQPDNSIHFTVYSPPFSSLYTYSNSHRDLGNCKDNTVFMNHYRFVVKESYRITMPGRLVAFHCMNLPSTKERDGYIGIKDFRGDLIRIHQDEGFIFHSEVVIWKDPVTAMQRTKALGLLHKQLKKDSCMSRMGIPDYVIVMRKPGDNPERVTHTNESFPVSVWQNYASPIWTDINPSDTLQYRTARENDDERHIAPLQLEVIRRSLQLWTNPGDIVFSPFAGIGSEGYVALEMGRKFIGAELKKSYFEIACKNLQKVEQTQHESLLPLFQVNN